MSPKLFLPVEYSILKPFRFRKWVVTLWTIALTLLALSLTGFTAYVLVENEVDTTIATAITIALLAGLVYAVQRFVNDYFWKTEIIGKIEIHRDYFILLGKRYNYNQIGKISIERYRVNLNSDSSFAYWKQCYKMELQTQNLRQEDFFIGFPGKFENKPLVSDVFSALQYSSQEMRLKIIVY